MPNHNRLSKDILHNSVVPHALSKHVLPGRKHVLLKVPFSRKKPEAEPGCSVGGHLP